MVKSEGNNILAVLKDITVKKKLENLSYNDQLTGLYNRRFYEEELKRLDVKENYPLTIVLGDVNGLKFINDSFGHVVGDQLIKKSAQIIKKGCRSEDIIIRLGGDEFIILLIKTDGYETEEIINNINVSELCKLMGKNLGLPERKIQELETAVFLHDIGKIAIDESILNKPGKLTDDEYNEIKRHSKIGYRILIAVNEMAEIGEDVLLHHEMWNGRGYPKGLKDL